MPLKLLVNTKVIAILGDDGYVIGYESLISQFRALAIQTALIAGAPVGKVHDLLRSSIRMPMRRQNQENSRAEDWDTQTKEISRLQTNWQPTIRSHNPSSNLSNYTLRKCLQEDIFITETPIQAVLRRPPHIVSKQVPPSLRLLKIINAANHPQSIIV